MSDQTDELDPLSPTPLEVTLGVVCLAHVALVAVVLVQLLRGRVTVPHGVLGVLVLLLVPVVGPLLVLTWPGSPQAQAS